MTRNEPPAGASSRRPLLLAVAVLLAVVAGLLWPVVSGERVLVAGLLQGLAAVERPLGRRRASAQHGSERQVYDPGWEARVDGRERPVLVANYVLRAVALEGGEHEVEFVFRPRSFRAGAALSVIAFVGLAAGARAWSRRTPPRPLG